MDINWEAISAVAGLLGAIGVIITLIYLSAQIRQNNNQLSGAATVAVYEYQRGLVDMLTSDTELYKIALRGNEDFNTLTEWEKQRFTLWCLYETGMWEMCHKLYKQGALDETLYFGKVKYWLQLHSSPGRRDWWTIHTAMLSDEFYKDVSAQLKDIPIRKLRETNPIFNSSVHDVKPE
ncbi:hypothetical protein [uncultured Winogradskyella sp.]|uniref:hypothetical protein n=1 Tax=uncultured Winogradskyella sp. TaxID=395353 RepID=UPI0030D846B6|tara:strand:+ start:5275 stop:5808 length:534 start_codon:yes stop_codon:yes gene_type:complete